MKPITRFCLWDWVGSTRVLWLPLFGYQYRIPRKFLQKCRNFYAMCIFTICLDVFFFNQ
jgi:hypothetical protein